ncbi:tryptophan halogenase family protein [Litorilituus lipolyticus]|uniref:Tryptophan 7-halogenase n=1 Tax=Litorilituus lipolyticus TaxID=2491017 RepID=A0A502L1W4_9GAMM|nr:tryptophan halogenase family protein [Litorilituus lipolyticus]TPH17950.1 tryptophan 7-halogenase [Litorilituus lipolyticus]
MQAKEKKISHIVIVGGGTAGWLAASHLAKQLRPNAADGVKVTLIESPNIPTIGVGEGTVPMMRNTLKDLGITETEFFKHCDATFKQGIKFVDWLDNPTNEHSSYYHHLFDYPEIDHFDATPYWLKGLAGEGRSFADCVSLQGIVCDAELAPKKITTPEYEGITSYGYHLDANKFSALLTKNAVERHGVQHIKAHVEEVCLNDDGEIHSVITKEKGEISGDFFVDCTGFDCLLLGKTLGVPFVDKSDVLFVDHALTIQIPYESEDATIPSYTISTAMEAGWIWDIGLLERRGVGHVYSSKYTSHEEAEKALRAYVGPMADKYPTRLIPMNIGHREKFWHKNCAALGLAQGFVEPLEATGLLVFDATAKMLAAQFPTQKNTMNIVAKQFNERIKLSWESVIDFVKLHYYLSRRDDNQFWLDNRKAETTPDTLLERLELWKTQLPNALDFYSGYEIFKLENYLYVLYGMEFSTDIEALSHRYPETEKAKQFFSAIEKAAAKLKGDLSSNRELVNKILSFGLQKV